MARILNAAACIKRLEDRLRRTTRDLNSRGAKCIEVGGGIFRTCIVNCNKIVISV